jgi:dephospho-CoA kinase
MSHVVSLIGPPAVGKSTFARWFVQRNPIYVHIDVATVRRGFGALDKDIPNAILLRREEKVWQYVHKAVQHAKFAVLESTGLSYRLPLVYSSCDSSCVVKLLVDKEQLTTRIIKRGNQEAVLELEYLEEDLAELSQVQADVTCTNLDPNNFPRVEDMVLMLLVERYNANPKG